MQVSERDEQSASYAPLKTIASGGMGSVELVLHRKGRFKRLLAMKRLLPAHRDDSDLRAMFLDEARLAGLIRHPNVVSVLDVGEDADGPYLVMEYVEGVNASRLIQATRARGEALCLSVALEVVMQAARGLHAAHELEGDDGGSLSLVHRDISPQNLLVGFDGVVRVTDFGIAKAVGQTNKTSTGILKGKMGYMPPEALRFERVDRRSDLFSLGVVLYELLAGERLYRSTPDRPAGLQILKDPPPDLAFVREDAPPELVELVLSMLAKEPDGRPADAGAVMAVLRDVIENLRLLDDHYLPLDTFMREEFAEEAKAGRAAIRELERTHAERETEALGSAAPHDERSGEPLDVDAEEESQPATRAFGQAALVTEDAPRSRARMWLAVGAVCVGVGVGAAAYAMSSRGAGGQPGGNGTGAVGAAAPALAPDEAWSLDDAGAPAVPDAGVRMADVIEGETASAHMERARPRRGTRMQMRRQRSADEPEPSRMDEEPAVRDRLERDLGIERW